MRNLRIGSGRAGFGGDDCEETSIGVRMTGYYIVSKWFDEWLSMNGQTSCAGESSAEDEEETEDKLPRRPVG